MTAKELLKRSYYALTSGLLIFTAVGAFALLESDGRFHIIHPILFSTIIVIVATAFCWIMTRHNRRDGAIILSMIAVTALLAAIYECGWYILAYDTVDGGYVHQAWSLIIAIPLSACMVIAGFLSNTKYHNILPNQSKGVSTIFRAMSWIGQIAVWGYVIAMLLTVLGVIK